MENLPHIGGDPSACAIAIIDRLADGARPPTGFDANMVPFCSNDARSHPDDSLDHIAAFADRHALPYPYRHDESQAVTRAYGAVCAPDFFGSDAGHRGQPPAGAPRDLFAAMRGVARIGRGPQAQTASMVCSVSWRA